MASLYDLTGDYMAIMDAIDGVEDESQLDDLLEQLTAIQDAIGDKAEAYARIIRNKSAEAVALKAEADRLTARRKAAERVVDELKARLKDSMTAVGATKLTTSIGAWSIQTNPPSVAITDEAQIPAEWRIPQPDKIDKGGILKWFKDSGEIIPGTEIERGTSIRFR